MAGGKGHRNDVVYLLSSLEHFKDIMTDSISKRTSKIDLKKAFKMRFAQGLTFREIGERFGVTAQAVEIALKPFKSFITDPEGYLAYRNNTELLLGAVECLLVCDLLDKDKRKKASLNNVAYAFQQIFNARRLEGNQSTANIGVAVEQRLAKALNKVAESTNSEGSD